MNWFDAALGLFSPRAALDRAKARAALRAFARAYDGAAQGRNTDGWRTASTSGDAEIAAAGPRLRDRSRDLTRNNPYAARAVSAWVSNLIGEGITPRPNTGDDTLNAAITAVFSEWSDRCDADGQLDFYGFTALAVREMVEGGEGLVRRRYRRDSDGLPIPMQVQLLEADFLDSSKTGPLANGNTAIQGVEFDLRGRRTAYWLWSDHPGNSFVGYGTRLLSSAVPASEILHLYEKQRTVVRGVPWSAPVIRRLRDLDDYQFAEGVRKKIESSMVGVVIGDDDEDGINTDPGTPGAGPRVVDGNNNRLERFMPGMFAYLRGGKDIKFNQPAVIAGFAEYEKTALRAIAAGWRLPYELLTGDLSDVNFSSARVGIMEFRRLVRQMQQQLLIPLLLDPLWRWFCEAAWLAGKIPVPFVPVEWSPPDFDWINPVQDVQADLLAVRAGFRSVPEIITESGRDPDKVLAEIRSWNAKIDAVDPPLILDSDPRNVSKAGLIQPTAAPADKAA